MGFLRSIESNFVTGPADILVPAGMIEKLNLREGSYIEGTGGRRDAKMETLKLDEIDKVNGLSLKEYQKIEQISNRTSINPSERFILTQGPDDLMGKVLDVLTPIGKGQRGLIVSPPNRARRRFFGIWPIPLLPTILRWMSLCFWLMNGPKR